MFDMATRVKGTDNEEFDEERERYEEQIKDMNSDINSFGIELANYQASEKVLKAKIQELEEVIQTDTIVK